jgi:pimeloyl-ACP methyl ester carboxylesterase
MPSAKPAASSKPSPRRKAQVEVVDPRWLIKAIALSLLAALLCTYAALCVLYYQGAWQLLLHPSQTIDRTPASAGLAFSEVHFDASETGQPLLTAWWVPAKPQNGFAGKYAAFTVLYLHDGSGSLSNTVPTLTRLNQAGVNIFAIDYRGFGTSDASTHPSDPRMAEDAAAALQYLTGTRHIPAANIIPYGTGLGASLAASLARSHPDLPAVILDNPDPDPQSTAAAKSSPFIPIRLLLGHPFEIAGPVSTLTKPKLIIAGGLNSTTPTRDLNRLHPASPTYSVTLPPTGDESAYQTAFARFLDQPLSVR